MQALYDSQNEIDALMNDMLADVDDSLPTHKSFTLEAHPEGYKHVYPSAKKAKH